MCHNAVRFRGTHAAINPVPVRLDETNALILRVLLAVLRTRAEEMMDEAKRDQEERNGPSRKDRCDNLSTGPARVERDGLFPQHRGSEADLSLDFSPMPDALPGKRDRVATGCYTTHERKENNNYIGVFRRI